jgi:chaperonin GroES
MSIRPLHDRVLVLPKAEGEDKSAGGIIIPETAKTKPSEGEVKAVGNGKRNEAGTIQPLDVKVGDKVIYSKYAGNEIKVEGIEHLLMREEDILAIIS